MRTLRDVVQTIEDGEFYQDYDQSSSDLRVLRLAIISEEKLLDLQKANEKSKQEVIK